MTTVMEQLEEFIYDAQHGHYEKVKAFIEQSNKIIVNKNKKKKVIHSSLLINYKNKNHGESALHMACKYGHLQIVQLLFRDGNIDINCSNRFLVTPLHMACEYGHYTIVQLLLQHPKININCTNVNGITPLHTACYFGQYDIVQLLLSSSTTINNNHHHDDDNNNNEDTNNSPSSLPSKKNKSNIININVQRNDGQTPLHLVTLVGGRSSSCRNSSNHTMRGGHSTTSPSSSRGISSSGITSTRTTTMTSTTLPTTTATTTPIMNDEMKVIELLFQYGVNIHKTNKIGKKPIDVAYDYKRYDIIELIQNKILDHRQNAYLWLLLFQQPHHMNK